MNVAYFFEYGIIISLLLSEIKLIFKEYEVKNFLLLEFLKYKFGIVFKHEYQFIKIHNMSVGKLAFFLEVVM